MKTSIYRCCFPSFSHSSCYSRPPFTLPRPIGPSSVFLQRVNLQSWVRSNLFHRLQVVFLIFCCSMLYVYIYIYMHPHHIRINNRKSSYMTTWYVTPNKNNKIMYHYFGWIFWNLSFWRLCLLTNTNQSHHVKSLLNRHHISIFTMKSHSTATKIINKNHSSCHI